MRSLSPFHDAHHAEARASLLPHMRGNILASSERSNSRLFFSHLFSRIMEIIMGFTLPQEYEEQYCPVDGFQLITYSTGSGMTGRSFSLCPNCYNNPPFPDMEDNCGCNKCTHTSCPHSMVNRGIIPCQDCGEGMVCMDPVSQTKKWRATCNSYHKTLGVSLHDSCASQRLRCQSTFVKSVEHGRCLLTTNQTRRPRSLQQTSLTPRPRTVSTAIHN